MRLRLLFTALMLAAAGAMAAGAPDAARLEAARRYSESCGGRTMLVMIDGKIVAEHYANGGRARIPQPLASGSKSFCGVAAAAAVQDGLLTLEERVADTVQEWRGDPQKSKITYDQLLHLCGGLDPGESPLRSVDGQRIDWAKAIAAPLTAEPGAKFQYGPHPFLVFGAALERKLKAKGGETFTAYLNRRVLGPIGVRVWWLKSPAGDPFLAGGALMTARDWAAFGEFMRLGGQWQGKQVIDGKLLARCLEGAPANPAYGLTWWLKRPVAPRLEFSIPLLRSEMSGILHADWIPGDFYMAAGAGKQRLYVIPSLKLVAVRQAPVRERGNGYRDEEFLRRLLLQSDEPRSGTGGK